MKKKKLYLTILITTSFLLIFFLQKFLDIEKKTVEKKSNDQSSLSENSNNLIKNLKYNVNFENNTSYTITALESELFYEKGNEIVLMKNVEAIFVNSDNEFLKITSKNARYNNFSYNTVFENQIKIEYLTNFITSEKLTLNFEENVVIISDNIVYEGLQGIGKADNIKINLLTKNIEISMSNSKEKIEIISKSKL